MKIRREIKRVGQQLRAVLTRKRKCVSNVAQTSLDLNLRLDYVVRELVRVQMQLEELHQLVLESIERGADTTPLDYAERR